MQILSLFIDCIVSGLGGLFSLTGLVVLGNAIRWHLGSVRTTGTVVRLEEEPGQIDQNPVSYYYPVVCFVGAGGAEQEFRHSIGSNPPAFREGDQVIVRYQWNDPDRPWIANWKSVWLLPLILLCASGGLLLWKWLAFGWRLV